MDKIKIKGLVQGTKKLKDGGFAVGFRTKWGTIWISPGNLHKFTAQNEHLSFLMFRRMVDEDELIGRYINVTNKQERIEHLGHIIVRPRL